MNEKPVLILPQSIYKWFKELPEDHPIKKEYTGVYVIESKPVASN